MNEPIITTSDILVQDAAQIRALEEKVRVLREALADAIEYVECWGEHASAYYRDKYGFEANMKKLRDVLEGTK